MADSIEVTAKTVDEAVEKALNQLGLTREDVEITVLSKGKSGILGLGSEEARVMVTPMVPEVAEKGNVDEISLASVEVVERLLGLMMLSGKAERTSPPPGVGPEVISLNLSGPDLGVLIGRRGQTLAALQYIANLILSHKFQSQQRLFLDVEGYRQRHYTSLKTMALRMADEVMASGQPATLEPMPPNERRIIHLALAEVEGVETRSLGEGEARKVGIFPKKAK